MIQMQNRTGTLTTRSFRAFGCRVLILIAAISSALVPGASAQEGIDDVTAAQIRATAIARQQLQSRVDSAVTALTNYFNANQSLPSTSGDMDKFLMSSYESISQESLPLGASVQPAGTYRKISSLRICSDPQVTNMSKINGKWQFPANWNADANDVVITTDGANKYAVWVADGMGKVSDIFKVGEFQKSERPSNDDSNDSK